MPACSLQGVRFGYVPATPVLSDVSLELGPGWHGLIGANGDGKTTLLRLLAGDLSPDAGVLTLTSEVPALLCPQTVEERTPEVVAFAESWEAHDARLRGQLGLEPDELDRWPTLSPGERKRWQIGAALAAGADVLLLDEPTNHLDADGRRRLLRALRTHHGIGVIVSHDRAFLDQLTVSTVRIRQGRAEQIAAPCSVAMAEWMRRDEEVAAQDARLRVSERRLHAQVATARRAVNGTIASGKRERRTGDPEARTMGRKNQIQRAEGAYAKQVSRTLSRLDRVKDQRRGLMPGKLRVATEVALVATASDAHGAVLAQLTGPLHAPGGRVLLRSTEVALREGDRVRLSGPNGAGKSTLIAALLAALPQRVRQRTGVLPQQLGLAERRRQVEALAGMDETERGALLALAARLGLDPGRVLATHGLSPGEARKLRLAALLTTPTALVVLDEPTNHLDLPAIAALQDALSRYEGTLLLVTHDDALASACTARTWDIGEADGVLVQ